MKLSPYKVAKLAKLRHKIVYNILSGKDFRVSTAIKLSKIGINLSVKNGRVTWGKDVSDK